MYYVRIGPRRPARLSASVGGLSLLRIPERSGRRSAHLIQTCAYQYGAPNPKTSTIYDELRWMIVLRFTSEEKKLAAVA
jgi:hypothetical protein